jgi:hypothetical protein
MDIKSQGSWLLVMDIDYYTEVTVTDDEYYRQIFWGYVFFVGVG